MEPPEFLYLTVVGDVDSTNSHLFAVVGIVVSVLFLSTLIIRSFQVRSESQSEEDQSQQWNFKDRISYQFAIDLILILGLSALVYLQVPVKAEYKILLFSLSTIVLLSVLSFIPTRMSPGLWFSGSLQNVLQRLNVLVNGSVDPDKYDKVKELEQVLENSENESTEEDKKMLQGIVKFTGTEVRQIMTRVSDIVAINDTDSLQTVLDTVRDNRYSRMPVYNTRNNRIIGILHAKDLIAYLDRSSADWKTLMRPAYFVSETKMIIDLLEEFQQRRKHIAIAVNETGVYTGIVSLEDIIEEIVGDISDEFDDEEVVYSRLDEQNYIFEARTTLSDLEKILDLEEGQLTEDHEGDLTIASLLSDLTGRVPRKNEKINFRNFLFTVEAADKRQIKRVKLSIES